MLQDSFYLSSTAALAKEYINSPFFLWLNVRKRWVLFWKRFLSWEDFKSVVFYISKNQNNFVLYYVMVGRFPFDISRWIPLSFVNFWEEQQKLISHGPPKLFSTIFYTFHSNSVDPDADFEFSRWHFSLLEDLCRRSLILKHFEIANLSGFRAAVSSCQLSEPISIYIHSPEDLAMVLASILQF